MSSHSRVAKKLSQSALSLGTSPRTGSAVSDRPHGRAQSGLPASFAEGDRGVLRALIGVMDDVFRPALLKRHLEGGENQAGAQVAGHGPAHDTAAEGIQDDGQVEEAGPGWQVGDVGHPQPVGGLGRELPVDQIGGRPVAVPALRGARSLAPAHPGQVGPTHQSGDPFAADMGARGPQLGMDAGRPIVFRLI